MTPFTAALRNRVTEGADPALRTPRAVLRLSGLNGVPAQAMLQAAEDVREAVQRLGIEDVRIEVVPQDEAAPAEPS